MQWIRQLGGIIPEVMNDGTLNHRFYQLRPNPDITEDILFKIQPVSPPTNPAASASGWDPTLDAQARTAPAPSSRQICLWEAMQSCCGGGANWKLELLGRANC